jgi:transposase
VADGKTRAEVADLLGRSVRQLAEWLRRFRNRGLDALCNLHHRGDLCQFDRERRRRSHATVFKGSGEAGSK